MKATLYPSHKASLYPSHPSSKGSALIIALAFVVLLTGITLAYFSSATTDRQLAQSSFNDIKADLLARSALDIVVHDLQQEIVNGSTGTTVGGITIYSPTTSANMLPRSQATATPGTTPAIPNLVRRSVQSEAALWPDPNVGPALGSRASAVNSTAHPSANGRSVSLARWNSHYMIPKANPADDKSDPITTGFSAPNYWSPDWVFVTNQGPTPSPAAANVIGRYAYSIYDEGGLIDVNVKGYPSPAPSPSTYLQTIGRKGSGVFTDLSQLNMSTTGINNLIGWRNYASAKPNGNLTSNFTFGVDSANRFLQYILTNTNGFLSTSGQTWSGGAGSGTDQAFITRQELVKFRAATQGGIFTANALQYLATFSRELNAPSWRPTQDASEMGGNNGFGNVYAYRTNADSNTAVNRNLLGVRVTNTFTRADGSAAIVGESLIKQRFPLTNINELINTANPNIQRDFGLQWDVVNNRWKYVGASTTQAPQLRILTLDEVANGKVLDANGNYEPQPVYREPNFFEVLKAVILSGSIGLGSGRGNAPTFVAAEGKYYDTDPAANPQRYLSTDYQIMQIGANMIDAWDSDNVPSFLYFTNNELAGVENLPYLNKIVYDFWLSNHGNIGDHDEWSAWLVPSFWNPNQNAALAPSSQNVRFVMTSGSVTGWLDLDGNRPTLQTATITSTGTTPYVEVKASQFVTPYPPAPSNERGSPSHSSEVGPVTEGPHCPDGCYDGIALADHIVTEKQAYKHIDKSYPMFAVGTTFQMQVQINGAWKPYQSWNGCSNGTNSPTIFSPGKNHFDNLQDPELVSLDPRTVRFGVWGSDADGAHNNNDYSSGLEFTMDENNGGSIPELITRLMPQPTSAFLTTGKTYLYSTNGTNGDQYADLDGVKRSGDWTTDINGAANGKTIMYPANSADRFQILSAPFQSVAELGQVFRDQPWKTLNFTTANSGDGGLLDVFTLQGVSVPMIAGRTSLNTRQAFVLKAILAKAALKLDGTSILAPAQVTSLATDIANITTSTPLINKTDLLAQLATKSSFTGLGNKEARECVMRAFSDACQTRTWNLLIDVIAQSGRYAPGESDLKKFNVEGEQRYWLHVAIDRFTGQVIDKQVEIVNE
jgi:hypothetical protein